MINADYNKRIKQLQAEMRLCGCGLVIVGATSNMRYLTGLCIPPDDRCELLLIPREGQPIILLSKLYQGEADALTSDIRAEFLGDEELQSLLKRIIPEASGKIALDSRLWATHVLALQQALGTDKEYISAAEIFARLRARKDETEISLLCKAGEISAAGFLATLPQIREGMTERALRGILETELIRAGGEKLSFDSIVAFGANAANPHHVPGETRLERGQFIVMDFGTTYMGYCADITRTVCFGRADNFMREIYETVLAANTAARAAVKAGIAAYDVEEAARAVMRQAGCDEYFIHRISHGVGMDVHEPPSFAKASHTVLETGMVFSIEPGIYIPNRIGIRIEDVVAVTEGGITDMHILDKSLLEL